MSQSELNSSDLDYLKSQLESLNKDNNYTNIKQLNKNDLDQYEKSSTASKAKAKYEINEDELISLFEHNCDEKEEYVGFYNSSSRDNKYEKESSNSSPDTSKLLELFKVLPKSNKSNSYKILFNESPYGFYLKIMEENSSDKNRLTEVFKYPDDKNIKYETLNSLIGGAERYFERMFEEGYSKYSKIKNKTSSNENLETPDTKLLKQLATLYFKDEDLSLSCEVQFRNSVGKDSAPLSLTVFINDQGKSSLGEILFSYPVKNFYNGHVIEGSGNSNLNELVKNCEITLTRLLKDKLAHIDQTRIKIEEFFLRTGSAKKSINAQDHFAECINKVKPSEDDVLEKILKSLTTNYANLVCGPNSSGEFYLVSDCGECIDGLSADYNQINIVFMIINKDEQGNKKKFEIKGKSYNTPISYEDILHGGIEEMKEIISSKEKIDSNFKKSSEDLNTSEYLQKIEKAREMLGDMVENNIKTLLSEENRKINNKHLNDRDSFFKKSSNFLDSDKSTHVKIDSENVINLENLNKWKKEYEKINNK